MEGYYSSILEKKVIAGEMAKNMAVCQAFVESMMKIKFQ
jgi:hypothetical protein